MKKTEKKTVTILLALIGAYLFYKESIGINVFVFTILSAIGVIILNKHQNVIKLIFSITPSILCSAFIVIYPQTLTYIIWLLSYLIMWSSMLIVSKPITILLQGLLSIIVSPIAIFKNNKIDEEITEEKPKKKQGIIYVISSLIVISFLLLYVKSNPIFSDLFSKIDLSFIEFGFVITAIGMYLLMFALTSIKRKMNLNKLNSLADNIKKAEPGNKLEQEFTIAKTSIWIVACLLLIANLFDIIVIITGKLPEEMTYSEYVHQGFNTLLFTLTLAIGLIIYFFRGQINFHDKVKHLKKASILWISQNLILALLTAYKNFLYVEVYGLTYKRIAVFLGLLCIIIGLVLSLKKIKKPLTNWFFFNKLALYAFISAVCISFVPYDYIITSYNLTHAQTVDIRYIMTLDKPNLNMLSRHIEDSNLGYSYYKPIIENKQKQKNQKAENADWQSWSFYLNENE